METQAGLTIDAPASRPQAVAVRAGGNKAIARLRATQLLGIPLAQVAYEDVLELVNGALADPPKTALTIDAINTMGISESCLDPRMRDAVLAYDVIMPDGMPLVWCMNVKGAALNDRVYGPYVTDRLLTGLARRTRVAVIGGFAHVHEWLLRMGPERYPNAEFTLLYDAPRGPIDNGYVSNCVARIEDSRAELVFVCLGVPRQYYWTALARTHLRGRVVMSIGGAFDLIAGFKRYAPAWIQRAGLTWLHRLIQEPGRLGPRYLKYNSLFLWLLLRQEVLRGGRFRATGAP